MSEKDFERFRNQILGVMIAGLMTISGSTILLSQRNSVRIEDLRSDFDRHEVLIQQKVNCSSYDKDKDILIQMLFSIQEDVKKIYQKINEN